MAKPVVTSVSAGVDLPSYQGPCPGKLTFAGTIITAVVPKTPVTYQWVRSDGVKGPKRTLTMTTTAAVVTDVWKVGTSGEMMRVWQELRILTPTVVKSNQASAAVLCR